MGADAAKLVFDDIVRMLLGNGGSGGALGSFPGGAGRRMPWAGFSGRPLPVECVAAPNGPDGLSMAAKSTEQWADDEESR